MEFIYDLILTLFVIFLLVALDQHKTKISMLYESLKVVERRLDEIQDEQRELDHRLVTMDRDLTTLEQNLEKADEIIKARAEYEKEAEKAEQLFQEGLQNILNYGVIKNG